MAKLLLIVLEEMQVAPEYAIQLMESQRPVSFIISYDLFYLYRYCQHYFLEFLWRILQRNLVYEVLAEASDYHQEVLGAEFVKAF
jgi:hypothetical protein